MDLLTFFLLIFVAAVAAGVQVLILGWVTRAWVAAFAAYAIVLVLPAVLPRLLGA